MVPSKLNEMKTSRLKKKNYADDLDTQKSERERNKRDNTASFVSEPLYDVGY